MTSELSIIGIVPDVILDWNTLMPLAKNIMSLECQTECFYEAQMLQSALQDVDFERIKEACIWFINRYNEVNG